MSHVLAKKTVASQLKSAVNTGAGKLMGSTRGKMDMGPMMMEGMGSMMKTPGVATGVVVSTGSSAGKSALRKVFTHPLVLFGLGVVAGCYIYKYRKSIISASDETLQKE